MTRWLISERTVMTVILLNTIALTVSGFYPESHPVRLGLDWVDYACVVFYVLEVALKIRTFGWGGYFAVGWNRFDFAVTLLCLPILWSPFLDTHLRLGWAPIFRTGRLFRLFRLLRFIPNIDHLLLGIRRALRASVGVLLALFLANLILALTATYMFGDQAPERFGDPARSFYSIFQVFTIEGWHEFPADLESVREEPAWRVTVRVFFILAVLGGGVLGLSLANAVFLDEMTMDNNRDLERKVDRLSTEIVALREELRRTRIQDEASPGGKTGSRRKA